MYLRIYLFSFIDSVTSSATFFCGGSSTTASHLPDVWFLEFNMSPVLKDPKDEPKVEKCCFCSTFIDRARIFSIDIVKCRVKVVF